MVFYFYPRGYEEGKADSYVIYMGRDKYENEDLIKYGLQTDIWFHVDDMSSAHVYLRLPMGATMDDIPANTLEDCAQLVKQNSIQGCKTNGVTIVYTPWSNLKKTAAMEVGQVGFHSDKSVRKVKVEKKNNEIINRLERTRREVADPPLAEEKEAFEAQLRQARHAEQRARTAAEKVEREEKKKLEEQKTYKALMKDELMVSNKELADKYKSVQDYEEDFM